MYTSMYLEKIILYMSLVDLEIEIGKYIRAASAKWKNNCLVMNALTVEHDKSFYVLKTNYVSREYNFWVYYASICYLLLHYLGSLSIYTFFHVNLIFLTFFSKPSILSFHLYFLWRLGAQIHIEEKVYDILSYHFWLFSL